MARHILKAMALSAMLALVVVGAATAQTKDDTGVIVPGDVLQMVVPGRPDLDHSLVVNAAGSVEVPQVGDVRLSGLSIAEAGVMLKQRLRLIAPTLDTVELTRAAVVSFRVYVLGQVGHPGAVEFKQLPSLWEVVRAAGGPVAAADLRSARIIREVPGSAPVTLPVDLSGVMEGTAFPAVELKDGDTLVVPALAEGVSGVPSSRGVKVFGGVGVPSIVAVDGPTPLMDVLMRAGAPTAAANMKKVSWVHQVDGVDQARVINLNSYLEKGNPEGNPLIHPGDTVNVALAKPGKLQSSLGFLFGTAASLAAVFIAINNAN